MKKQLKVLQFICPTGFYGAERWILALAKNLEASDIKCDLAVTIEGSTKELEITKHYAKLNKNVHEIPMSGKFDVSVISKLCKLIKENDFDIIHTHGYKSDILGLIAARLTGIKALATPHGFENSDDWKLKTYIRIGNLFLRWFDSLAPLSKQLCRDLDQIGVASNKVTYIQNGVDLDEVEQQRSRKDSPVSLQKTCKRIGFVGQMISRKNIFDLLDIFDELRREHSDIELVLLGDGEQRIELESYANKLPSRPSIKFLGFRDDRLEWLQSFDIFVMTSTLEGIPRCLMETMAMGIPVAAYDIPGIDQLISNNKTGLLAPLGDKEQLKKHWESIIYNEELSSSLVESASDFVYENFSGKRMAREYTVLFKELLA